MSPTNEIVEENNYYPFGLKHKGYNNWYNLANANALAQQYKYNGKELQTELGLNMYDYGARNYDPALGRWMNMDPLAEKFNNISPYAYSNNSPIFFVDRNGMEPEPPSQAIPDNSVIQLKGVNSSMLTQELIKTSAAMGGQPITDFKANNTSDFNGHRDGKNGLSHYIQNRLSGTTGVEDFMAEFDDSVNDDEVLINVTPELISVDASLGTESGSTSENSSNSSSSSSEISTSFGAKGEGGGGEVNGSVGSKSGNAESLSNGKGSSSSNVRYKYNATFKIQLSITYKVEGYPNGNSKSQTVTYYYGQTASIDKNGNAVVKGEAKEVKGAIKSNVTLDLN